jgi:hypothetical protein
MMVALDVEGIVETYFAAWAETDEERRRALIERVWDERGVYLAPTTDTLVGREALAGRITGFQQRFPGHRLVMTSGVDGHHDRLRYGWAILDPQSASILEGMDIGEIGLDGRLLRVTEYFGPLPPLPPLVAP